MTTANWLEWWGFGSDKRASIFRKLYRLVGQRLDCLKPKAVLDLGAGKGVLLGMLAGRRYWTTYCGVERDEQAVKLLRQLCAYARSGGKTAEALQSDIRQVLVSRFKYQGQFDLIALLFTAQYLLVEELEELLGYVKFHLAPGGRVLLDVSNSYSLYRRWCQFRGFQSSYQPVYPLTPCQLEELLDRLGFEVTWRRGVGLLLPLSLLKEQRIPLVPVWLAQLVSKLDWLFPRLCQQYLVEAELQ